MPAEEDVSRGVSDGERHRLVNVFHEIVMVVRLQVLQGPLNIVSSGGRKDLYD